ncbi:hypothetical protein LLG10_06330 [bacterium]|nr:hypothetical protein [bacterium]
MPINPEIINSELVKFGEGLPAPLPEYFENLKNQYCQLTINGLNDKEGYELVHKARMNVRDLRVKIEKKRKELKADSIAYGNAVDGEAKRINALIEPIETYLADQEQAIDAEKERIRKAKEEERMAEIRAQIAAEETKKLEAETARLEEVRKAQAEEQKRLQAEREAMELARKVGEEALLNRRIEIEAQRLSAEKIASQKMEESKKIQWNNPTPLTPEQQEIMKKNVAITNTISSNHNSKQELIALFFEPYDENCPTHVNAPIADKHYLYGTRYIVRAEYAYECGAPDIIELILNAIFPTEVTNGRE